MALQKLRPAQPSGGRQMPRRVDQSEVRVAEFGGEFSVVTKLRLGICLYPISSAMRTRRLSRPFFSICVTVASPISPVRATCVPPHG